MRNTIKIVLSTVIITIAFIILIFYLAIDINSLFGPNTMQLASSEQDTKLEKKSGKKEIKIVSKIIDRDENNNINIYKKVSHSVVNISTQVIGLFSILEPSPKGSGSGCVLDKQGYILTNYHVIEASNRWVVTLSNSKRYLAKLIGVDPENDLAMLKIDANPKELIPIKIAKAPYLEVGQKVLAIGNPFGLERTLTNGIISSLGRVIKAPNGAYISDTIQTNAAINPGNSGGPLLNMKGELIGINTFILSPSGGSVGIGFAVPSQTILLVKRDLIRYGRRPKLGIESYPLSWYPGLNKYLGLPITKGVVVFKVSKGYAADRAGIRGYSKIVHTNNFGSIPVGGDIILAIDNEQVSHPKEIIHIISKKTFGDSFYLTINRNKENKRVKITLLPPKK